MLQDFGKLGSKASDSLGAVVEAIGFGFCGEGQGFYRWSKEVKIEQGGGSLVEKMKCKVHVMLYDLLIESLVKEVDF